MSSSDTLLIIEIRDRKGQKLNCCTKVEFLSLSVPSITTKCSICTEDTKYWEKP